MIIGHVVHVRDKYKDGVYFFDLKGLDDMKDVNQKVK